MTPRILRCAADGPSVASDRDAAEVVADAPGQHAELVVVPVARLTAGFFALHTGVAGTAQLNLVRKDNRGRHTWIVADTASPDVRLAAES